MLPSGVMGRRQKNIKRARNPGWRLDGDPGGGGERGQTGVINRRKRRRRWVTCRSRVEFDWLLCLHVETEKSNKQQLQHHVCGINIQRPLSRQMISSSKFTRPFRNSDKLRHLELKFKNHKQKVAVIIKLIVTFH